MSPLTTRMAVVALALASSFPVLAGEAGGAAKGKKVSAAEKSLPSPPSPALAPELPSDPAAAEVARAIREARKELESAQSSADKESSAAAAKVAELTADVSRLRDEERKLLDRLKTLEGEGRSVEAKLAAISAESARAAEASKAVEGELEGQAAALRARFAGSLAAAEDPRIPDAAAEAMGKTGTLKDRITALLEAYEKVLVFGRTVGVLPPTEIALASAGGRIEKTYILRLGLLGGLYSRPARNEGGFVFPTPDGPGFRGDPCGLDAGRQALVSAIAQRPEKGGVLPLDVTGGAALALAVGVDPPLARIVKGGPFLWALAAIGALAALVILERGLILILRSMGLRRRIDRVIGLIDEGRIEAARAACSKYPALVRAVLVAPMDRREAGRAAMESAVGDALIRAGVALRGHLGFLSTCAAVAAMIGFAGTVTGLLGTFGLLGTLGTGEPKILSSSLAEALLPAQVGLVLAVPCLFFRGLLGGIADRSAEHLEAAGLGAVAALLDEASRGEPLEAQEAVR